MEYASFLSIDPLLSISTVLKICFNFFLKPSLSVNEFNLDIANLRNLPLPRVLPNNCSASKDVLSSFLKRLNNIDGVNKFIPIKIQ